MLFSFGLGLRYQASADLNGISALHFFPRLPSEAWAPTSPALVKSSSPPGKQSTTGNRKKGKTTTSRGHQWKMWENKGETRGGPLAEQSWQHPLPPGVSMELVPGGVEWQGRFSRGRFSKQHTQHAPAWETGISCLTRIVYLLKKGRWSLPSYFIAQCLNTFAVSLRAPWCFCHFWWNSHAIYLNVGFGNHIKLNVWYSCRVRRPAAHRVHRNIHWLLLKCWPLDKQKCKDLHRAFTLFPTTRSLPITFENAQL